MYVEKVNRQTFPELGEVADDIEAGRPVALATVIEHPDPPIGSAAGSSYAPRRTSDPLGSDRADAAVYDDALGLLASGHNATLTYGPDGERRGEGMRVFVWAFAPAPRMLVFGAIDFAAAVARVGAFLGYHVTVCDARPVFATTSRFPDADEVVVDWPHRYLTDEIEAGRVDGRTVVCVLTHDPKFDIPVLAAGAEPRGRLRRRDGLPPHPQRPGRRAAGGRAAGIGAAAASSPIGLDLGARTPEETAVSIAAEIVAAAGAAPATRSPSPTAGFMLTPHRSTCSGGS